MKARNVLLFIESCDSGLPELKFKGKIYKEHFDKIVRVGGSAHYGELWHKGIPVKLLLSY